MRKGTLYVFTGPSGAGKGTVLSRLLSEDEKLFFSILAQQPGQHCALACTGRSGEYIQRSLTHLLVLLPRSRPQNEPQRSPAAEH